MAAAQEERFTRKRHDAAFPRHALAYCLEEAGLSLDELDAVVFYDKPFLKFERLLETYYAFAPRGLRSFLSAMPVWIKEKLMLKRLILDELSEIGAFDASIRQDVSRHEISPGIYAERETFAGVSLRLFMPNNQPEPRSEPLLP